jgi:hypothetical protein
MPYVSQLAYTYARNLKTLFIQDTYYRVLCSSPQTYSAIVFEDIGDTSPLCFPIIARVQLLPNFWTFYTLFKSTLQAVIKSPQTNGKDTVKRGQNNGFGVHWKIKI